jgi:hypothetical protein
MSRNAATRAPASAPRRWPSADTPIPPPRRRAKDQREHERAGAVDQWASVSPNEPRSGVRRTEANSSEPYRLDLGATEARRDVLDPAAFPERIEARRLIAAPTISPNEPKPGDAPEAPLSPNEPKCAGLSSTAPLSPNEPKPGDPSPTPGVSPNEPKLGAGPEPLALTSPNEPKPDAEPATDLPISPNEPKLGLSRSPISVGCVKRANPLPGLRIGAFHAPYGRRAFFEQPRRGGPSPIPPLSPNEPKPGGEPESVAEVSPNEPKLVGLSPAPPLSPNEPKLGESARRWGRLWAWEAYSWMARGII